MGNNADSSQSFDPFGLSKRPLLAIFLIFVAGLGLALTPCILPMLPIVANIVARQEQPSTKRSFLLSSSYGLGVAVAYGLLGAIIAYVGASVGLLGYLQNPIILISFAVIFVILGLYMLELIKLSLPAFISKPLNRISQKGDNKLGSISGSFIVGLLSALVVSPCVSAPLSGVLLAVSSIGNPLLGFAALFALGFGLSLPLVIFATTEGKLLPQAGEWMHKVKQAFAYLMFAVALLLLERVFTSPLILVLWAVWFVLMGICLVQLAKYIRKSFKPIIYLLVLCALLWSGALLFGALQGNTNSLNPLVNNSDEQYADNNQTINVLNTDDFNNSKIADVNADVQKNNKYIKVTTLQELDELLSQNPKVIVDVMADWCIECKIIEKELFVDLPTQGNNWQIVKLDITETSAASKAILSRYEIVGPPTLLYYVNGQLMSKQVGKTKRAAFVDMLKVLNTTTAVDKKSFANSDANH